jgi:hypothetical protein
LLGLSFLRCTTKVTVVPAAQPDVIFSAAAATIPPTGQPYLRIDASSILHTEETLPNDPQGCAAYPTTR